MRIIFAIRKVGAIAQLVEHRTENPGVPGSIPGGTTLLNRRSRIVNDLRDFCFGVLTEVLMALLRNLIGLHSAMFN